MTTTTLPNKILVPMGIAFLVSAVALAYIGYLAVSGGSVTLTKS